MTTTEPQRTDRVRDLIAELLVDDIGRQALVSVLLEELAERDVVVRRLVVRDELGRDRVELYGQRTHGAVRVNAFSDFDEGRERNTYVEMSGNEESVEPSVDVHLCAGGSITTILGSNEDGDGGPGRAYLTFDEQRAGRPPRVVTLSLDSRPGTRAPAPGEACVCGEPAELVHQTGDEGHGDIALCASHVKRFSGPLTTSR
jgi:hypothetical protein